jgi:hypothetical protein
MNQSNELNRTIRPPRYKYLNKFIISELLVPGAYVLRNAINTTSLEQRRSSSIVLDRVKHTYGTCTVQYGTYKRPAISLNLKRVKPRIQSTCQHANQNRSFEFIIHQSLGRTTRDGKVQYTKPISGTRTTREK